MERVGIDGYRGTWGAGRQPKPHERRENVVPFRKPGEEDGDPEDEPT